MHIDLNADLGETTAGNPVADDAAMLEMVSSANVATGFHAGDPHSIAGTLKNAAAHGVTLGAHVAYNDPAGFGRRFIDYAPAELADETLYQIGALDALARVHGMQVRYVKPHGALYNAVVHHEGQAAALVEAVRLLGDDLVALGLPGSAWLRRAEEARIRCATEGFADRAYTPEGHLVPRSRNADPQQASRCGPLRLGVGVA